jgi:hypothetical protein
MPFGCGNCSAEWSSKSANQRTRPPDPDSCHDPGYRRLQGSDLQVCNPDTLDAFGAGFVIAGVVDVVVVSGLNRRAAELDATRQQNLEEWNRQAREMLQTRPDTGAQVAEARQLLHETGGLIDPQLRIKLADLVDSHDKRIMARAIEEEMRRRFGARGGPAGA